MRLAAMPTAATPFRWQSVAETDRAIYRYVVTTNEASTVGTLARYAKPTGADAQLVAIAERERRAPGAARVCALSGAQVDAENCIGQALVQFADLRYTEPGAPRGNFSVIFRLIVESIVL